MTYDTEAVVLWTQEGSFTTLLINAVLFQWIYYFVLRIISSLE